MYFSKTTVVSFGLLATTQLVAGHSAIVKAVGDAGGAGSAIGIDPDTPRDGTGRKPFQQDATRFKGDAKAICGETLGGGDNDIQAGTTKVMQLNGGTLPQVSQGGSLMMTLHQVNGDGAGPYTCMIDSTGTGTNWTAMTVSQNVDGNARGRNNANAKTDLPLQVAIASDQTCTGTVAGQSNVCMVRCQNPARAGPFGGCVPVQMAGAAGAAAPAAASAPAAAAAAPVASAAPVAAAPVASAAAGAAPLVASPVAAAPLVASLVAAVPLAASPVAAAPVAQSAGALAASPVAVAPVAQATSLQSAGVKNGGASTSSTSANTAADAEDDEDDEDLTKRSTKELSDGTIVTDDEDEEEIFADDEDLSKRWAVSGK